MSLFTRFVAYPLLAVIGLCLFLLGFGEVIYCLPFFFLVPAIVDGIVLLLASFHGIFLRYPNRGYLVYQNAWTAKHRRDYFMCHFCFQLTSLLLGAATFLLSVLELLCTPKVASDDGSSQGAVCYSIQYRTGNFSQTCLQKGERIRAAYSRLLNTDDARVATLIASGIVLLSLTQFLCTAGFVWWSAVETKLKPKGYHMQLPLGVLAITFGVIHTIYCGTYYYIGFGIWAGALIMLQGGLSWYTSCKSTVARAVNMIGSGLGMALAATNIFGMFCWFNKATAGNLFEFQRHCEFNPATYEYCRRVLIHSQTYYYWPQRYVQQEIANLQLVAYVGLMTCGVVQFVISLRATFTRAS